MEVIALVVAGLSLVGTVVGTYLSDRRSRQALRQSNRAAESALWSDAQAAVQRLIGFDPSVEPLGERLQNLRIAFIELVDGLPDWNGLDTWLEAERELGAVLGRQLMDRAQPGNTVEKRLQTLGPYQRWAQALGSNLRRFRTAGFDADAAKQLREHAEQLARDVYEANGWEPPDRSGFQPLGE